jgi:glycosyltransferase involved in cell wall biosynthesis
VNSGRDAASLSDDRPSAFVVPFYGDQDLSVKYLAEAISGFDRQTDPRWRAIIVDDATPRADAKEYLAKIEKERKGQIHVIHLSENMGLGNARNVAVKYATSEDYPFVMYNDADDVSHPDRVGKVRAAFSEDPSVDMVYSTFRPIDENGCEIPEDGIVKTIQALLSLHRSQPIMGQDAWIRMGLESTATLPSSTALRTSAALACPSPLESPQEGFYQMMHVSAAGGNVVYVPSIPTLYRITSSVSGLSHHRKRVGVEQFYQLSIEVRTAGFVNALRVAGGRGHWCRNHGDALMNLFNLRLADNLAKVGQSELAVKIFRERLAAAYPAISTHLTMASLA